MPRRYEMVDEPDGLEVAEDDVYHPDQSVVMGGDSVVPHSSIRSLEPIVAGPIGLKTVFYDPRCTPNQRKLCFGTLMFVSAFCLAILIALFVGLGKVLSEISHIEEALKHGVQMRPDLRNSGDMSFVYSHYVKSERRTVQTKRQAYINEIANFLNAYDQKQKALDKYMTDCAPGTPIPKDKFCRFDWKKELGSECTQENDFGYKTGKPCILFAFHDVDKWLPKLKSGKNTSLPFSCKAQFQYSYNLYTNITYYPQSEESSSGSFAMNKIPTRLLTDKEGDIINDENGHEIKDLPALLMVQVTDPPSQRTFSVDCRIVRSKVLNMNELHGTSGVAFDFIPFYDNAPKEINEN